MDDLDERSETDATVMARAPGTVDRRQAWGDPATMAAQLVGDLVAQLDIGDDHLRRRRRIDLSEDILRDYRKQHEDILEEVDAREAEVELLTRRVRDLRREHRRIVRLAQLTVAELRKAVRYENTGSGWMRTYEERVALEGAALRDAMERAGVLGWGEVEFSE
jgi:hypothetical protein